MNLKSISGTIILLNICFMGMGCILKLKKASSVVLIVSTSSPLCASACNEACSCSSENTGGISIRSILSVIGGFVATYVALSHEDINKFADDINDEMFGVTRRGYIIHGDKRSFIVPAASVLFFNWIGRTLGDLVGKICSL